VRKHRLLVAARLVPLKRVAAALRVCHQLQQRWPDTTLVVLGEGPERPAVERLAADLGLTRLVSFRGRVSQAEVFHEMGEAEVFILLSANPEERLPNAVKEAMLCRCLCVVSNSKGISELVVNAETGFVVDPDDFHAAAQRVEWIFTNPERAREMAAEAYRHVVKHFDIDQLTSERLADKPREDKTTGRRLPRAGDVERSDDGGVEPPSQATILHRYLDGEFGGGVFRAGGGRRRKDFGHIFGAFTGATPSVDLTARDVGQARTIGFCVSHDPFRGFYDSRSDFACMVEHACRADDTSEMENLVGLRNRPDSEHLLNASICLASFGRDGSFCCCHDIFRRTFERLRWRQHCGGWTEGGAPDRSLGNRALSLLRPHSR